MKELEHMILDNKDNPGELEKLYRQDQDTFTLAFDNIFLLHQDSQVFQVWNVEKYHWIGPGNIAFSILPALAIYFVIKNKPTKKVCLTLFLLFLGSLLYINVLPHQQTSTVQLANIHLPFFLWTLLGIAFMGNNFKDLSKRMEFLKYNGEVLIYTAIILIGGIVLTALTLSLFSVIDVNMEDFYFKNVVVYGAAASPIVGTYLAAARSKVARNFAPYLAKIFSPLVLITLVVYLVTIVVLRQNPYTDRNFLIAFNLMLLVVLAIAIFTITERETGTTNTLNDYIAVLLVSVALLVDAIALSAIIFRLSSYGISPNRIAVLGVNLIVFTNLIRISYHYWCFILNKTDIRAVKDSITRYLPVYSVWTIIVVFIFPLVFWFK